MAREKGLWATQLKVVLDNLLLHTYEIGWLGGMLGTATTVAMVTEEFPLGPSVFTASTHAAQNPKSAPNEDTSAVTLVVGGVTHRTDTIPLHCRYTLYRCTWAPPPDHEKETNLVLLVTMTRVPGTGGVGGNGMVMLTVALVPTR